MLANYRAWSWCLSNLKVLGTVCWEPTGFETKLCSSSSYLGLYVGKLETDVCPTWATWDCMLATTGLWDGCLSNCGLLGTVCWQTIGALRRMFVQLEILGTVCRQPINLGLLGGVCWQPTGLWDGCFVQLGATWDCMLASYSALRRMFCPTWGYLGLYVGNLQGFETDVCSPGGYWDCMLATYTSLIWMFVQLGATWVEPQRREQHTNKKQQRREQHTHTTPNIFFPQLTGHWDGCLSICCYLGLYVGNLQGFETDVLSTSSKWGGILVTLRRKFVQLGASWGCMLATYRLWHGCLSNLDLLGTVCWQTSGDLRRMFCPTWGYLRLYVGKLQGFETDVLSTSSYWGGMW